MFDGRDYKVQFDETCDDLVRMSDRDSIRRTLIGIEWVLEESIRGVFVILAFALSLIIFIPLGYLFKIRTLSWIEQGIFCLLAIVTGLLVYWLAKFIFWYEVSRHLKPRNFGELSLDYLKNTDELV
jgi:ABC-type antimicrobial peptide transport system permease subunit